MYKIKVSEYGSDYKVNLYKKGWLFWNLVESKIVFVKSERRFEMSATEIEIKTIIRQWQAEFHIPDERVIIKGV